MDGQKPVADLSHDDGIEYGYRSRGIEETEEAERAVGQWALKIGDEDAATRLVANQVLALIRQCEAVDHFVAEGGFKLTHRGRKLF